MPFAKRRLMATCFVIRGVYSQKKFGGGVRPASETLTLLKPKICNFPYLIYDLTKTLMPYL